MSAADALGNLVTKLNHELRDLPPGPERNARLRQMAQGYLDGAQTDQERRFWEAFLTRVAAEPVELSDEQADALRAALRAAQYEQEFDEGNEVWFSPETDLKSRTVFFSRRTGSIVVSYADARTTEILTFREAMDLAHGITR